MAACSGVMGTRGTTAGVFIPIAADPIGVVPPGVNIDGVISPALKLGVNWPGVDMMSLKIAGAWVEAVVFGEVHCLLLYHSIGGSLAARCLRRSQIPSGAPL